jgi:hypothetical protein
MLPLVASRLRVKDPHQLLADNLSDDMKRKPLEFISHRSKSVVIASL